jgi:hypothetical protein
MTEVIDFTNLSNVPDGEYPTNGKFAPYPIVIIQDRQVFGFRNDNGDLVLLPEEGNFDLPPIPFVPPDDV